MKNNKLDMIVKGVVISASVVFVLGIFFPASDTSNDVYAQQKTIQYEQSSTVISSDEINGSIEEGIQVIEFDLKSYEYPTLNLQVNEPVKLIINVDEYNLNSCNYRIISQEIGLQYQFDVGQNLIEFTPTETGEYVYSCWMGMLGASVNVTNEDIEPSGYYGENVSQGGCCSVR